MQANFILDYDILTPEQAHTIHVLVHIQSNTSGQTSRRPLNLSVVIDRSGSMAGPKIDYTRQAAQFLVQHLSSNDMLSIVLYNDKVETLLPPENIQRKDIINQRIATIKPSGTTNLSGGWLSGCNWVSENLDENSVNRVIVMTDGLANRGVTDSNQLVNMVKQKYHEGVSTTTMGLGKDFNEDLLIAMAGAGGGAFYFIESPEVTPLIFQEELQGLLNVVAQNLLVTVGGLANVRTVRQLNGYSSNTDSDGITFNMGDVFGEEVKALLLEISLEPFSEVGQHHIANLTFEYDELSDGEIIRQVIEMPIMVTITSSVSSQLANPEVEHSRLLLNAAHARKSAIKSADQGEFNTAAQVLRNVATAIDQSSVKNDELLEEQKELIKQATDIEHGASFYDEFNRKMMMTQAFYTMVNRHDDTMMLRSRQQARQPKHKTASVKRVLTDGNDIKVERIDGESPTKITWKKYTFTLEGDLIRIGRSHHNEVVISASGVSRFHCQLKQVDGQLMLEDLGSTNGTVIDGDVIGKPYPVSVGDIIYLCDEKTNFSLITNNKRENYMSKTFETHTVNVAGVSRDLRLFEIKAGVRIAILNILGDTEFVQAVSKELAVKLKEPQVEVLVTAEAKSIPLAHGLSVAMNIPYVVLRKSYKTVYGRCSTV